MVEAADQTKAACGPARSPSAQMPYPFASEAAAFENSVFELVKNILMQQRNIMVPAENVMRYRHGRTWKTHYPNQPSQSPTAGQASAEMRVPFADLVDGNVEIIYSKIQELIDAMHASFMTYMYSSMSEITAATGQTINAAEAGSPAQAFLAMLKKIEFGIDRSGRVSIPEIHAGSKAVEALTKSLAAEDTSFREQVDQVMIEKQHAALAREQERRARFLRYE
jgi:hypothetical protein